MPGELRTNSFGDRLWVEAGCRCRLLAFAGRPVGLPDGGQDGEPELLRVLLVALHLDNCQPVRPTRPIRPGPQQRGLAAACGRRDKRHLRLRRTIEGCDKVSALNQPHRTEVTCLVADLPDPGDVDSPGRAGPSV